MSILGPSPRGFLVIAVRFAASLKAVLGSPLTAALPKIAHKIQETCTGALPPEGLPFWVDITANDVSDSDGLKLERRPSKNSTRTDYSTYCRNLPP